LSHTGHTALPYRYHHRTSSLEFVELSQDFSVNIALFYHWSIGLLLMHGVVEDVVNVRSPATTTMTSVN
jgi:hypothetical protein